MSRIVRNVVAVFALLSVMSGTASASLDDVAEAYVKLVLSVGVHDEGYVDAYYGPAEWREAAVESALSLDEISARAAALKQQVAAVDVSSGEDVVKLRHQYLDKQLDAMIAYVRMLGGERMDFDKESKALYDAVAPTRGAEYFQGVMKELDAALPGDGPLSPRIEAFRSAYTIPVDKLDAVFTAAITECRKRTVSRVALPEGENFEVQYVTDKPWSAYNWYKGNGYSVIQVNTELPIRISRAIDLACHEGYPGHHVYNALLEKNLARDRGWVEFTVYPLFSPQSLIAEGSANFGIEVAFPNEERIEFEKRVLFPLAGLDPETADDYYKVEELMARMDYAGNEAARQYLNGNLTKEQTIEWLVKNALASPERATQRVSFYDTYRSYVINYNLGQDLVRDYVNALGGTADNPEKRWDVFLDLLSSPRLPSGLVVPAN